MLFDPDFLFVPVIFSKKSQNKPQNMRFAYGSIFEALALSALFNYAPAANKNAVFTSVIDDDKNRLNLLSDISAALLGRPGEVMVVLKEDYRAFIAGKIFMLKSMKAESLDSFSTSSVACYLVEQAEKHPNKFSVFNYDQKPLTLLDIAKSFRDYDFKGDELNRIEL